jgi:integrase/recombinase XerD
MAQPVEYAVAVDKYLDAAALSDASRRIYRIALNTWAWALVDRPAPEGAARRGAKPPIVPLAVLDEAGDRVRDYFAARGVESQSADPRSVRTINRELSILRSAIAWWLAQGWIAADPTNGVSRQRTATPAPERRLESDDVRRVFALRAPLRDQALWHVLHESGATIERVLALNVSDVDPRGRSRIKDVRWRATTAQLITLLLAGRAAGPVFLTDRRAPADTPAADRCPHTGRGRLSYRRAAEIFADATRGLDPQGRGWTLRQLQTR